jgi:hypothetical protein
MKSDPSNQANTALAPHRFSLDQIIAIWLHEKANRARSAENERAYNAHLTEFRALLQAAGKGIAYAIPKSCQSLWDDRRRSDPRQAHV